LVPVVEGNLNPLLPNNEPPPVLLAVLPPKSEPLPAVALLEKLNNPEDYEGTSDFESDPFLSGDTVLIDVPPRAPLSYNFP
jgi:hypothetical protein